MIQKGDNDYIWKFELFEFLLRLRVPRVPKNLRALPSAASCRLLFVFLLDRVALVPLDGSSFSTES